MQDNQQYEQLILQYNQLKNGAEDIFKMIESEDFDGALTLIKSREAIFLNCKCMRKYLELSIEQEKEADALLDEIRTLEKRNIEALSKSMQNVQSELKKTHKTEKIHHAYDFDETQKGSIVNLQE